MPPTDRNDRDRRDQEQVYSITSAATGHSDELGSREKRYAISMGIRSVCFVGAVVVWQYAVWVAVVMVVLATFLPYLSVVLANSGVRRKGTGEDVMKPEPYGELSEATAAKETRDE